MRADDREREDAVASLRKHYVSGRIGLHEFSDRVDLALRARSRAEVGVALRELPLVWEDLPLAVRTGARKTVRGARRLALLFVVTWLWIAMSIVVAFAFGVATVAGEPSGYGLLAFPGVWVLATFGLWRFWRHRAARA